MKPAHASGFRIRKSRPEDIPDMVRVVNAAFSVESFLEGNRTHADEIAKLMHMGEFLVADTPLDGIRGVVFTQCEGDRGHFGMLAVDPAQQGSGLGRKLVAAAEEHCRGKGCKFVEIVVLSLRSELRPFYERQGYRLVGTREFRPNRQLKPGFECHGLVMAKQL